MRGPERSSGGSLNCVLPQDGHLALMRPTLNSMSRG
jgi:hypothetical protein